MPGKYPSASALSLQHDVDLTPYVSASKMEFIGYGQSYAGLPETASASLCCDMHQVKLFSQKKRVRKTTHSSLPHFWATSWKRAQHVPSVQGKVRLEWARRLPGASRSKLRTHGLIVAAEKRGLDWAPNRLLTRRPDWSSRRQKQRICRMSRADHDATCSPGIMFACVRASKGHCLYVTSTGVLLLCLVVQLLVNVLPVHLCACFCLCKLTVKW